MKRIANVDATIDKTNDLLSLASELKSLVTSLCDQGPRSTTPQIRAAETWITDHISGFNVPSLLQPVLTKGYNGGYENRHNIITKMGLRDKPKFIFMAHYDTVSGTVGADDNASGVAGLLALMRLFSQVSPFPVNAEFVFLTNEEPPHFGMQDMGSSVFFNKSRSSWKTADFIVNLDCIGYFSDPEFSDQDKTYAPVFSGYVPEDHASAIVHPTCQKAKDLVKCWPSQSSVPLSVVGETRPSSLGYLSDMRWVYGEYPCVHFNDDALMRNALCHSKGDVPSTLDWERMAGLVQGVFDTILTYSMRGKDEFRSSDKEPVSQEG